MAVLWITVLNNQFGKATFNQTDSSWSPQLKEKTYPASKSFSLQVTEWNSFVVPWIDKGKLHVQTNSSFECYVAKSHQGETDSVYVRRNGQLYLDKVLGPQGHVNRCCTLLIKDDGNIDFINIVEC